MAATMTKNENAESEGLRLLTLSELQKLFYHTRGHVCGLMLRLIYASGMRLHEAVRLRVGDLHFERNQILVRNDNDEYSHFTVLARSIEEDLRKAQLGKSEDDYLFSLRSDPAGRDRPVSRRTVQHYLARAVEELGLEKITVQLLRDNFALHLIRKGVDHRRIMELMGYRNVRSFFRYVYCIPESEIDIKSPLLDIEEPER